MALRGDGAHDERRRRNHTSSRSKGARSASALSSREKGRRACAGEISCQAAGSSRSMRRSQSEASSRSCTADVPSRSKARPASANGRAANTPEKTAPRSARSAPSSDSSGQVHDYDTWDPDKWAKHVVHTRPAGKCCLLQNENGIVRDNRFQYHSRCVVSGLQVCKQRPHNRVGPIVKGEQDKVPDALWVDSDRAYAGVDSWHSERQQMKKHLSTTERAQDIKMAAAPYAVQAGAVVPPTRRHCKNVNELNIVDLVVFNKAAQRDEHGRTDMDRFLEHQSRQFSGAACWRPSMTQAIAEFDLEPKERNKPQPVRAPHPMTKHHEVFLDDAEVHDRRKTPRHLGRHLLPTIFISHGMGGMPAVWSKDHPYVRNLRKLPDKLGLSSKNVRCILCISAHWQTPGSIRVTKNPGMNSLAFDFSGCPHECYSVPDWFSYGCPAVADKCVMALCNAGIPCEFSLGGHSLDHGVHIPLRMMTTLQGVPVVQLSIPTMDKNSARTARTCLLIGKALRSLRSEGVLIIGSGQAVNPHKSARASESEAFVNGLKDVVTGDEEQRDVRLQHWETHIPYARRAHGTEDHLLPLLICAGAAEGDKGSVAGDFWDAATPMTHFVFGERQR
eukprot:TRINITY_DN31957_c0_g1_i1.p1 TRINITY_DN31957_c0_g1~~TRINITY_DN31957_c0_g1_i1.p1  ORF type:complete len:616 (-),score=38.93 TRINITY_DN31957_c0_g1_i1:101-1948(-)